MITYLPENKSGSDYGNNSLHLEVQKEESDVDVKTSSFSVDEDDNLYR